jgi:Protein of unknown function (DUF2628)
VDPGPSAARPYELRVSGIPDSRARLEVARRLGERFPALRPPGVARALEGAGFVGRLELRDAEAPQLLRQLYDAGAPPAAVVLVPCDPVDRRDWREEDALAASFAGGRFVATWNWAAFVFGPLWYLRKGLYAKGLLILALTANPFWSVSTSVLVSLPVFVYCGAVGNWDYYLLRVKRTQWW